MEALAIRRTGESETEGLEPKRAPARTFDEWIQVEGNSEAAAIPSQQLPAFVNFLKANRLSGSWTWRRPPRSRDRITGRIRLPSSDAPVPAKKVALRGRITALFGEFRATAEPFTTLERRCRTSNTILVKYLLGRQLQPPDRLPIPA